MVGGTKDSHEHLACCGIQSKFYRKVGQGQVEAGLSSKQNEINSQHFMPQIFLPAPTPLKTMLLRALGERSKIWQDHEIRCHQLGWDRPASRSWKKSFCLLLYVQVIPSILHLAPPALLSYFTGIKPVTKPIADPFPGLWGCALEETIGLVWVN